MLPVSGGQGGNKNKSSGLPVPSAPISPKKSIPIPSASEEQDINNTIDEDSFSVVSPSLLAMFEEEDNQTSTPVSKFAPRIEDDFDFPPQADFVPHRGIDFEEETDDNLFEPVTEAPSIPPPSPFTNLKKVGEGEEAPSEESDLETPIPASENPEASEAVESPVIEAVEAPIDTAVEISEEPFKSDRRLPTLPKDSVPKKLVTDDGEVIDLDNPLLEYDEEEDSHLTLEEQRLKKLREKVFEVEQIQNDKKLPNLDPSEVSKYYRKPLRITIFRVIPVMLVLAILALVGKWYVNENGLPWDSSSGLDEQALKAEYDNNALSFTNEIACPNWTVHDDSASLTKNIQCADGSSSVLFSVGKLDSDNVWLRAGKLVHEDSFVVTDNLHWGVIAIDAKTLVNLAEKHQVAICSLKKDANLVCPEGDSELPEVLESLKSAPATKAPQVEPSVPSGEPAPKNDEPFTGIGGRE